MDDVRSRLFYMEQNPPINIIDIILIGNLTIILYRHHLNPKCW